MRFACGSEVGNRDCKGGQFSLLLDIEGRLIAEDLSFVTSCDRCLLGDCLFEAFRRALLESG
jgi:hypothetical protein